MKLYRPLNWAVAAILLTSCTPQENRSQLQVNRDRLDRSQKTITLDENFQVAMGQTIYVPVYSHIYHQDEEILDLAAVGSMGAIMLRTSHLDLDVKIPSQKIKSICCNRCPWFYRFFRQYH